MWIVHQGFLIFDSNIVQFFFGFDEIGIKKETDIQHTTHMTHPHLDFPVI